VTRAGGQRSPSTRSSDPAPPPRAASRSSGALGALLAPPWLRWA